MKNIFNPIKEDFIMDRMLFKKHQIMWIIYNASLLLGVILFLVACIINNDNLRFIGLGLILLGFSMFVNKSSRVLSRDMKEGKELDI